VALRRVKYRARPRTKRVKTFKYIASEYLCWFPIAGVGITFAAMAARTAWKTPITALLFSSPSALPCPVFLSMDVIDVCSRSDACSDDEQRPGKCSAPAASTALLRDDCEPNSPMPAPGSLAIPTRNSCVKRFMQMRDCLFTDAAGPLLSVPPPARVLVDGASMFACSMCPQRCPSRSKYVSHERSHTGEKPFKCS
jgi:hypothetical protein